MSISTRMSLLMGVIVLAVLVGVGGAYYQIRGMTYDGRVVNHSGIVRGATQRLVKLELAGQPADKLMGKIDRIVRGLLSGDEELDLPAASDPAFRSEMEAVAKAWSDLKSLLVSVRSDPALKDRVLEDSETFFKLTNRAVFAAEAFGQGKVTRFLTGLAVVTLVILSAVGLVWWTLLARVASPIRSVAEKLRVVAGKDVTVRLDVHGEDEIADLAKSANATIETLRDLVSQADDASQELASVSQELSATTAHIAASNEGITDQSQGMAAGAQEMNATVQDVARNAREVNDATDAARQCATDGGTVIAEAVDAMNGIARVVEHAASTVRVLGGETEKIGTVVQLIEDIADQTNLLALNAAIEAARAGEHGRGFAVVADEVRKLAEKTMKATQEIAGTISRIQQESRRAVGAIDEGMETVERGKELGERAGESIREIEDQVANAAGQTEQIAAATEQLSATIREMATNMEEIAKGVGQTMEASTEVADTAGTVAEKADQLRNLTAQFRT